MVRPPHFADRADAGRRLAEALRERDCSGGVVCGLARGGVPVAAEVAAALSGRLDVLVVRKVGHPAQLEFALGAVSEDGVVDPADLPDDLAAPHLVEARARAQRLRNGARPIDLTGRTAVVVDDGLATGHSMAAALETARRRGAARVVMAAPVAAGPGYRALEKNWEGCAVAVIEPPDFFAVGQFYEDFGQVSDAQVASLIARARAAETGGGPPATA
jgi:putative phosphoribosyl transferase